MSIFIALISVYFIQSQVKGKGSLRLILNHSCTQFSFSSAIVLIDEKKTGGQNGQQHSS